MTYKFDKLRVLVVEDNIPMLEICKALLLTFGVGEVLSAKNGEVGFELFCKENPDLVIADWMMYPMDGISLTRRIRNDPRSPNQFVPIILMTGFSEKKRVVQARDSGVTEFLVKPFTARDLYKRVTQIIERPRQFVKSEDFFGPDRRRKADLTYNGPLKRESDAAQAAVQKARMKMASAQLSQLRQQAGLSKGDKITEDKLKMKHEPMNSSDIDFN